MSCGPFDIERSQLAIVELDPNKANNTYNSLFFLTNLNKIYLKFFF